MASIVLERYLELRKELLRLYAQVPGLAEGKCGINDAEESILAEMDDLWYNLLSETEIEYINSLPSNA
jgi:hypothetical protein